MKTDELTREKKQPRSVLSRALQDLAPQSCVLLDRLGHRAPFSSVGYVLHAGKSYRLRIVPPEDGDVIGTYLAVPPDCLQVDPEAVAVDEEGRAVREIGFRVRRDLAAIFKFGNICCDELAVHLRYKAGCSKIGGGYTMPFVVRPGFGLVLFAVASTLLLLFAPILVQSIFANDAKSLGDLSDRAANWLTDVRLWAFLGLCAIVVAGVFGRTLWQMRQQHRVLLDGFTDAFPTTRRHQQGGRMNGEETGAVGGSALRKE